MQAKDDLVLEDGDVDPLMLQDEDAEGQAEFDFDDLEAALAAELQLEDPEVAKDFSLITTVPRHSHVD